MQVWKITEKLFAHDFFSLNGSSDWQKKTTISNRSFCHFGNLSAFPLPAVSLEELNRFISSDFDFWISSLKVNRNSPSFLKSSFFPKILVLVCSVQSLTFYPAHQYVWWHLQRKIRNFNFP